MRYNIRARRYSLYNLAFTPPEVHLFSRTPHISMHHAHTLTYTTHLHLQEGPFIRAGERGWDNYGTR
jgi:hypothetical protein